MKPVLVAYATVYGSTREVAEKIADVLRTRGLQVDLRAASEVRDVAGFSAVVLGSALYFFRMHKDGRRLLARHHGSLSAMPLAVFALGPFNDDAEEFEGAREQLVKALGKHPDLKPAATAVFGGKFDPEALHFPHKNPAMKAIPASDIRDWDAIAEWAESLPQAFGITSE